MAFDAFAQTSGLSHQTDPTISPKGNEIVGGKFRHTPFLRSSRNSRFEGSVADQLPTDRRGISYVETNFCRGCKGCKHVEVEITK